MFVGFLPALKACYPKHQLIQCFFSDKASLKEQSVETLYFSSYCSTITSRQSSSLCPLVLPHCLPLDGFPCFTLLFFFFFLPFHLTPILFSSLSLFLESPILLSPPISQLSFVSSHLCHFLPSLLSSAFFHHLSPFTEGLCASFASLCCSWAFISAAGAPLAGCQSLLVQKPAHSSNTIHCTCIRTQPIVTARPSYWNHPISFLKFWGVNSLNSCDNIGFLHKCFHSLINCSPHNIYSGVVLQHKHLNEAIVILFIPNMSAYFSQKLVLFIW